MKLFNYYQNISPLARKMVFYVVLASTFITIFTSAFQLYEMYKVDVSAIEIRLNEVRDSYSKNIASRLWVSNKNELDITLQGILRLPDIEYIAVYEDDKLVVQHGELSGTNIIERDFPLHYYYRNEWQKIGRVHITATLANAYNHIYEQAITIVVSNTIKTFLVASFMFFLFYTLVIKHLIEVNKFAENINLVSLDNILELKRKNTKEKKDELAKLTDTLINLQERLKVSVQELKKNEIILKNNEAKFRGFLESTINGILMVDSEGVITLANNSICDLTGYTREELVGEKVELLVPLNYKNHKVLRQNYLYNPSARSMGSGKTFEARRKDGSLLNVEVSLAPVSTAEGVFVAAMIQDVTVRVKIEKEKEALLRTLEYKNEELERFTYTVSHDLKSPLVTINGFIGLLKKDIAENNQKRVDADFNRISDAANIMQTLLDDLLDLSRIGRQDSARVDVAVRSIIDDILNILSVKIKINNIKIIVDSKLPFINVELVRFKEVYLNLIDNAIKYRRNDVETKIEIGMYESDSNGEKVFFVKDNGIGIDPLYHDKIFGLFERLSVDTEGTGVGLAIVKRIIDVHDGRVWVESEGAGTGSTFKFVLPNYSIK